MLHKKIRIPKVFYGKRFRTKISFSSSPKNGNKGHEKRILLALETASVASRSLQVLLRGVCTCYLEESARVTSRRRQM